MTAGKWPASNKPTLGRSQIKKNLRVDSVGLQEAEDVELVNVLDTSVGECENCPSELQECNVQRCVDLCSDIST